MRCQYLKNYWLYNLRKNSALWLVRLDRGKHSHAVQTVVEPIAPQHPVHLWIDRLDCDFFSIIIFGRYGWFGPMTIRSTRTCPLLDGRSQLFRLRNSCAYNWKKALPIYTNFRDFYKVCASTRGKHDSFSR